MRKHYVSLALGVALVVVGAACRYQLGHVEVPIVGMRQLGLVLMVCGLLDVAASVWALASRLRS